MRHPWDVPWRPPKGLNVRDLQWTFRGLLGDQQKIWWFDEKSVFRCISPCFTHLLLFFTGKNKYSKVRNGDIHGTSRRPRYGTSRRPNDGPWDVGYICFLNSTQKYIKLTLTGYSRVCGSEKFSEQYSNLNNINWIIKK